MTITNIFVIYLMLWNIFCMSEEQIIIISSKIIMIAWGQCDKAGFPSYDRVGGLFPMAEHFTLHLAICMAVCE